VIVSYFFSDVPKGYDTHIDLATFLEILISISEYPICSAIEFLQYHEFQNKIQFYYLESISYKPIELVGGGDIVRSILCEIDSNYPLTTRILTELPSYIMDKICNIYFNPIELNELDFLSKLDFDFTDQRRILDLGMHDYTIQGRLIDEKLSNLVLQFGIVDKNIKPIQLPIDEIKTLVTYFHHQFVIKNNNLELVNQDVFSSIKNELTFTNPEPKTDVYHQHIAELESKIADLENQLAQAKAELADKPADEVELNPKTKTSATRIMNVLFHKAQLDITAHQGTTNKTIVNLSKSLNATITEKPVIFWIKEVQQLRIDTEKDN